MALKFLIVIEVLRNDPCSWRVNCVVLLGIRRSQERHNMIRVWVGSNAHNVIPIVKACHHVAHYRHNKLLLGTQGHYISTYIKYQLYRSIAIPLFSLCSSLMNHFRFHRYCHRGAYIDDVCKPISYSLEYANGMPYCSSINRTLKPIRNLLLRCPVSFLSVAFCEVGKWVRGCDIRANCPMQSNPTATFTTSSSIENCFNFCM